MSSEYKTRRDKIDVFLKSAGWDTGNNTKVVVEVDTKQSLFSQRIYKTFKDTFKDPNPYEKAYADYLLLDSSGSPIAVIEAKKTTRSPISGQKQAEGYATDIKIQTGKNVFIFLTNGFEIWFWNRYEENPRMVKGFHSKQALERIVFQNLSRKDFVDVPIRREIVDRPYQIESVKRVLEGISIGRRKFLIVQATGTGKTRVAMALIDVLLRSNHAQKILFLADRKALRDQAFTDGFKTFFPNELKTKIFSGKVEKTARLFASTIQTFMECYHEFSIGDFDVIVSDEAHRSIYNKWRDVFTYFDAIEVGLTATPAEMIERDTFRFFDCHQRVPAALYTYEEAIADRVLVPFKVYRTQTHFQIAGVKPQDVPNYVMKELLEQGIEPDEINFDGSDIEKKVAVIGTNEAIVKEFMENCITDSTGTLPAKSIFFAVTKHHAKRIWEAFERLYPEYKGELARIITSDDDRAQESLNAFKKENWPRVAISVDMLDTGVDVPEVCNLVFLKPIFSKIKFWQMIGRGTRSDATCLHKQWLPNFRKEDFLIFDCWNVFEWFNLNPEGRESKPSEAITSRIFLLRLQQLKHFMTTNDNSNIEKVKKKISEDISDLPMKSVSVSERAIDIELAQSPKLWTRVGFDPLEFLKTKITPLMKFKQNVEPNEASFTLKCEKLSMAILKTNFHEIDELKDELAETLNALPLTIAEVKNKEALIDRVLSPDFWTNLSYDESQTLISELAHLMKYKRSEPRPSITLDIDDAIQEKELIEYGPAFSPKSEYVTDYKDKVEKRIKRLAEEHPTMMKIKQNEVLTEEDLHGLEKTLNSPELFITEEALQKAYKQHSGTLIEFIKVVLGLYEFPNAEKKIEEAFKTFMVEKNYLIADQVNFLRTIESVFTKKHHIDFQDFFEPPFTNFGPKAPLPLFRKDEIEEVLVMCNNLESQVFRNARS